MHSIKKSVIIFLFVALPLITLANSPFYNIYDYGANGDGVTLNTKAIQSAIDACSIWGGGTVYFPAGKFISGTIFLKSYVTLFLDAGATLIGSKNLNDYPVTISKVRSYTDNYTDKSLIYGEELKHIAVVGRGTIDGNGATFKGNYKLRPYLFRIINCKNVLVRDVTILNSAMWVQHYLASEDINIEGITVNSRVNSNNDGIDIDACNNVRISNCTIISGDDAIVLKSTLDQPCKNITVTNCVLSSLCSAFKLGSESNGGFQNINLSNCVIYDTHLSGIALETVDGAIMDRVSISNITMNNVEGAAIFIRLGNRARPFNEKSANPEIGKLSNIIISGVQATNVGFGCSITGLPGYPVENITLQNIRITYLGGGTPDLVTRDIPEVPENYPDHDMFGRLPAYGFYCRHAKNLTFNDVEMDYIDQDARPAIIAEDIVGFELYKIKAKLVKNGTLIHCKNVKNMFVQSCISPIGIKTFLQLSGKKSEHITLIGNDLSGAKNAIQKDDNIEVYMDYNKLNRMKPNH